MEFSLRPQQMALTKPGDTAAFPAVLPDRCSGIDDPVQMCRDRPFRTGLIRRLIRLVTQPFEQAHNNTSPCGRENQSVRSTFASLISY